MHRHYSHRPCADITHTDRAQTLLTPTHRPCTDITHTDHAQTLLTPTMHRHYSHRCHSPSLGVTSLTPCVTVVVLGLFSTDDEVKPDHFVYDQGDKRLNSITVSGTDEVFMYIISHFSHPNALTLDITSGQGMNVYYVGLWSCTSHIIVTMATKPDFAHFILFSRISSFSSSYIGMDAICVVQKESVARVMEKLHQLPDIEEEQ